MYQSRILPKEEWHKLKGTEAEPLIPLLNDREHFVLVVEKEGVIVGNWILILKWHAECVWIDPDEKGNPVVAKRLVNGMMRMAKMVDTKNLITSALTDEVEQLIIKHLKGSELPGKFFVFPVE